MATDAKQKIAALEFWDKHGLMATKDFYQVSRSTLYLWRKHFDEFGVSALQDASKAPHHRRRRNWPSQITDEIRRLRHSYPNMGAPKIYYFLKPWCDERGLQCPKPRTIARLIADAPDNMCCSPPIISGKTRKRKAAEPRDRIAKGAKAQFPGHCVAMDSIHYFVDQTRYYLFTAIDHYSRFAVAITCRRASSKNAAAFAKLVHTVFPNNISQVLTDNGSEFQGHFDAYLQHNIKHCYTYPRCLKMNALDERFNRTIQEEFVAHNEDILMKDLALFNDVLFEYLGRYNFRRPHWGLGYKTPAKQLASFCPHLSNMSWHRTFDSFRLWN